MFGTSRITGLFFKCIFFCVALFGKVQGQEPIIVGTITGVGNKPIKFWYTKEGKRVVDSVYAENDKFIYKPARSDDSTVSIYISGSRLFQCWIEPGAVTISGSAERPARLNMTGATENTLQHQYNTTINWHYDDLAQGKSDSLRSALSREKTAKTIEFIKSHPESRVAADLLYWQSVYNEDEIATYETIWKEFKPAVRGSKQGARLSQRLETIRNQPIPGKAAPDFAISDTSGNLVALKDFRGKYVLLDFWGHWCGPCVKSFPSLKALNDRLAGKMQIMGIAAEYRNDRDKWLKMIRSNKLDWVHLTEFQADKGKVNTTYNIMAFPTYFLIDKEGIVLAKSNSLTDIEVAINAIPELK